MWVQHSQFRLSVSTIRSQRIKQLAVRCGEENFKQGKKERNIMSKNLTVTLVSGTDNDLDANIAAFTDAYLAFMVESQDQTEKIAAAVHAVFDQYPGMALPMPSLANFALNHLTYTPATFKVLQEKVCEYVRDNADRSEKKDENGILIQAAEAPRTRLFKIAKGKGGGVTRWSDVPVKA